MPSWVSVPKNRFMYSAGLSLWLFLSKGIQCAKALPSRHLFRCQLESVYCLRILRVLPAVEHV